MLYYLILYHFIILLAFSKQPSYLSHVFLFFISCKIFFVVNDKSIKSGFKHYIVFVRTLINY